MPKHDVFISHTLEERELADLLRNRLHDHFLDRAKVFVSFDSASIPVGDDWLQCIHRGLRQAGILLVVCSKSSIRRPWINFEAGAAWMNNIPIIPVCHTGLTPDDLPMPLKARHALEAHDVDGLKLLYSRIADHLKCNRPEIDFHALAQQVRELEARYEAAPAPFLETRPREVSATALSRLEQAINAAPLGWTLCFVGEDQSRNLAVLTQDLRRGFSDTGDAKQFASGFSYWGIGPTLAWESACNDPFYLVMKKSIESFPDRWNQVKSHLATPHHFVSLGVGTGTKDRSILRHLSQLNPDSYYFPVDMSPEMLRVGTRVYLETKDIFRCRLLPIQIDFSIDSNVAELRRMLLHILGDAPILFSLLGNTLANFEADTQLLNTLRGLMRPQDRLLLEVATTDRLDEATVHAAADEYDRSRAFKDFATSALLQYTDLPPGIDTVEFHGLREGDRAILVKVVYRNLQKRVVPMKLPDDSTVDLVSGDTIRLYVSRKYTSQGITSFVKDAGFSKLVDNHYLPPREPFGLDLILLEQNLSYTPSVT